MRKGLKTALKAEKKLDNYIWSLSANLGSGPFGQIFKGIDIRTQTPVAIKILPLEEPPSATELLSLNKDIIFFKQLENPYLVKIFDIFVNKRHIYIIEEYFHEGDLRKCLSKHQGPLSESLILSIFKQLIYGIQALQSFDCFDCNLKPENILIFSAGKGSNAIKIVDFWIPRLIKSLKIMKTPCFQRYHSPQILKEYGFTNKCEIWSLGIMLYESIFGKLPWNGLNKKDFLENIKNIPLKFPYRIEVSQELKILFRGCLEYQESSRFSLKEVLKYQEILKKILEKKSKFQNFDEKTTEILKKIQVILFEQKLPLDKLFKVDCNPNNPDSERETENINPLNETKSLLFKDFVKLIKILDQKMNFNEIQFFYERLDPENKGISLEDFKDLISDSDFTNFEGYEDPFLEEKAERVTYSLRETILRNKINVEQLFQSFDVSGECQLNYEEFDQLLLCINPRITHIESQYLFQQLDFDKSGDIDVKKFKAFVLRDVKLEEKYKFLENRYKEIRIGFKELMVTQKIKLEKVFEKFAEEKNKKITINGIFEFLKILDPKIQDEECEYIFQRMDVGKMGFLTKDCFIGNFLN